MRSLLRKIGFSLGGDDWEQRGLETLEKVISPRNKKTLTAISDQGLIKIVS